MHAHAKVNLTLEVLGRRDDGFHEVASIVQTVDLHDTLTLEPASELALKCDYASLDSPENLAFKAACLLKERARAGQGARIELEKRIPVAAGLGGGSSDAAATLTGLNRLWGLGISIDELSELAAELGSDVPFFLHGGTAVTYGRGERVRSLPAADLTWLVLLSPDILMPNKTATMYSRLSTASFTRGDLTRKLEARVRGGGDVPPQFLFNAFDDLAVDAYPGLNDYWRTFSSLGAKEIHLAGSGPSMFAPVSSKEVGTALSLLLRHRHGWTSHLVSLWQPRNGALL